MDEPRADTAQYLRHDAYVKMIIWHKMLCRMIFYVGYCVKGRIRNPR